MDIITLRKNSEPALTPTKNTQTTLIFLQKRTHRAGAQKMLLRLVTALEKKEQRLDFFLICSEEGWLADACRELGVSVLIESFPSVRSIPGRLFLNDQFARRIKKRLVGQVQGRDVIINANDIYEVPLANKLSHLLNAKSVLSLHSAQFDMGMWQRYQCDKVDRAYTVSEKYCRIINESSPSDKINYIPNGLLDHEFWDITGFGDTPQKIGVIGSSQPVKGWRQMVDAIQFLDQRKIYVIPEFVFIGRYESAFKEWAENRLSGIAKIEFTGEVEFFQQKMRECDLIIHPSRLESFGMAALEAIAAGCPLLSTDVGVLSKVIHHPDFLIKSSSPDQIACALEKLLTNWQSDEVKVVVGQKQQSLKDCFSMSRMADQFIGLCES